MKLLIAINSADHNNLADLALRWCGRLGFNVKVFVPKAKRYRFINAVAEANYHYYLALPEDIIISRTDAYTYAYQHDYDLLVTIPEGLKAWRKGSQYKDAEIKNAYMAIAKARLQFHDMPKKRIKRWSNGVKMERL